MKIELIELDTIQDEERMEIQLKEMLKGRLL